MKGDRWGNLRVDVVDDEIIVTLPGTSYGVTYFKRLNSPQLVAKNISHEDDKRTPLRLQTSSLVPGGKQTTRRAD